MNASKHTLTKTNFIQFLNCPKSLWLLKNKPEDYPHGEFSLFLEKLIKEGYEVESFAMELFPYGIDLGERSSVEQTSKALESKDATFFQASFQTTDNAFARLDIIEKNEDGTLNIYEIKSSTEVKRKKQHDHVKDICFQKYVIEKSKYRVKDVFIIHLNKEYVRDGEINPHSLLTTTNVTGEVNKAYDGVVGNIDAAIELLQKDSIQEKTCSCMQQTRSNHCDSFQYFNSDLPDNPIYHIGRISKQKIWKLVDEGLLAIKDIDIEFELNEKQKLQVLSVKSEEPLIDYNKIKERLDSLKFPLHFIDYETYASAVPRIDEVRPHQHIPFQVSIHTLKEDGSIEHCEYLADTLELPEKMLQKMKVFTGSTGTYISWHASYEKSRNVQMIDWFPEYREYLIHMNNNMFDLEDVFKEDYVDYRFKGSTSIKKVLPVIIPNLSYDKLEVRDGTTALDLWGRMVLSKDDEFVDTKEKTREDLLEYCKLDTWAMVEIYRFLIELNK